MRTDSRPAMSSGSGRGMGGVAHPFAQHNILQVRSGHPHHPTRSQASSGTGAAVLVPTTGWICSQQNGMATPRRLVSSV
ncbi:hypothetical protein GQ55_8G251400 [Panicum hallii var. hallii]|uniref:Uncharacterized protein n=1 Tax=Panicum hallii var. hallii TaxID=1504633 RepID=A0A2T7CR83_9POAL|nr:hypothetical protein GQ55_8G251400 [Panicum hallii var. hallii]